MATPRKPRKRSEAVQHAALVTALSAVPIGEQRTCQVGETRSVAIERLAPPGLVWWYGWLPGRPHGGIVDIPRAADLLLRASGERYQAARLVRRSRRGGRSAVTMDEARPAVTRCLESTQDYLARRRPRWAIDAWSDAAQCRNGVKDLKSGAGWMFAHYGPRKGEGPGELWFYGQDGVDPRGFASLAATIDRP